MKSINRGFHLISMLLIMIMVVAFSAVPADAATRIIVKDNTTNWNDGNEYIVYGEITIDSRIEVTGNVVLNVDRNAKLTAKSGIHVSEGAQLTIEGTGTLVSTGVNGHAGIGGNVGDAGGSIIINNNPTSNVSVEATGGYGAAGIGGAQAPGLAPSASDYESDITIGGGTVTATGGTKGSGIGSGYRANAKDATITINGGTVIATGKDGGAGIGGGVEGSWPSYEGGEGATVNINGGTVIASGYCAIGHGDDDSYMGELSIADNMKVYAGNNGEIYERNGKPFTKGERVDACNYRKNARIEVCDHPDSTYRPSAPGHTQECKYCATKFSGTSHSYKAIAGTAVESTCVQEGKEADEKDILNLGRAPAMHLMTGMTQNMNGISIEPGVRQAGPVN